MISVFNKAIPRGVCSPLGGGGGVAYLQHTIPKRNVLLVYWSVTKRDCRFRQFPFSCNEREQVKLADVKGERSECILPLAAANSVVYCQPINWLTQGSAEGFPLLPLGEQEPNNEVLG